VTRDRCRTGREKPDQPRTHPHPFGIKDLLYRTSRARVTLPAVSVAAPDDVEARARRLALSRGGYVRPRLAQNVAVSGSSVSTRDLTRFAETFSDLADPDRCPRPGRDRLADRQVRPRTPQHQPGPRMARHPMARIPPFVLHFILISNNLLTSLMQPSPATGSMEH
jgi:hypothetical protein